MFCSAPILIPAFLPTSHHNRTQKPKHTSSRTRTFISCRLYGWWCCFSLFSNHAYVSCRVTLEHPFEIYDCIWLGTQENIKNIRALIFLTFDLIRYSYSHKFYTKSKSIILTINQHRIHPKKYGTGCYYLVSFLCGSCLIFSVWLFNFS